jgi:hypothetical protein
MCIWLWVVGFWFWVMGCWFLVLGYGLWVFGFLLIQSEGIENVRECNQFIFVIPK